jgi:3'-phosphoadenosine 5'-phosphosulfate sulfotransferase (PAPS reductase)/FAD synthetase
MLLIQAKKFHDLDTGCSLRCTSRLLTVLAINKATLVTLSPQFRVTFEAIYQARSDIAIVSLNKRLHFKQVYDFLTQLINVYFISASPTAVNCHLSQQKLIMTLERRCQNFSIDLVNFSLLYNLL